MPRKEKGKYNWCFTINNYTECPIFNPEHMKWLRYGQEVGESGTPHLQGVIQCTKQETLQSLIKKLGWKDKAHFEQMKGTIMQNIEYTGKEATEENGKLVEFGTRPLTNTERRKKGAQATKERYMELIKMAEEGRFEEIKASMPGDYIRHKRTLNEIHHESQAKRVKTCWDSIDNWWIVGATGTGKSRAVHDMIPREMLYKKDCNKWWDGYNNEQYVLIDDFQPDWPGKNKLKNWADHYDFPAEVKGGKLVINPRHIIVTSNYSIEEGQFMPNDIQPIVRRFKQVGPEQFREEFKLDEGTGVQAPQSGNTRIAEPGPGESSQTNVDKPLGMNNFVYQ